MDTPPPGTPGPSPYPPAPPMYGGMPRPPMPPGAPMGYGYPPPPRRRSRFWTIAGWTIALLLLMALGLSLLFNLFALAALAPAGAQRNVTETQFRTGSSTFGGDRIVILPVIGVIEDSQAAFIADALVSLENNPPKAVILRVDSPGGTVSASDRIWNDLVNFRSRTNVPVIASYGSVAASGGYYISAMADTIMAEPTTITGSIGVIMQGFTFSQMLDKIGVEPQVHHSDRATMKDVLNPMRPWEPKDEKLVKNILNQAHERFVKVVTDGRKNVISEADFKAAHLDSGAPFTADEALANKLVDEIGYLGDAIVKAESLAGLINGDAKVTIMERPPTLMTVLMGASAADAKPRANLLSMNGEDIRRTANELSAPRLEYLWVGY